MGVNVSRLVERVTEKLSDLRVLVVGDVMLDAYDFCYTDHSRPSPERPDKRVYTAHRAERVLGGAGNVAANLASLGVQTELLSVCGEDGNALEVKRICQEQGIEACLLEDESRPTPVKTRLYIDDQYMLRRDDEQVHKLSQELSSAVLSGFERAIGRADAVILSDYNKGLFTADNARAMIRLSREKSIPVIVDLKPANASFFQGASLIAPNLKEARKMLAGFDPASPAESMAGLQKILGTDQIVVTLGADGMLVCDQESVERISGQKVDAVDPCGCGDTVRACLALGLVSGLSLVEAASFANMAASLVVQKLGTACLTAEELINLEM